MYSIKIIKDMEEFQELEADWNNLIKNQKYHVPFLCYEWFRIWLKYFLNGDNLFIVLLYKQNQLITIAPFIVRKEKFRGLINVKKVELIGNVHSPIRNFIQGSLDIETTRSSLKAILSLFEKQFKDWDIMELDSLPEEDPTFGVLSDTVSEINLKNRRYFCFADWYLDGIDYSGDQYINQRPKNLKLELKRRKKRLEEMGHLELEVGEEEGKLNEYTNIYYYVREKSWKKPEADIEYQKEFRKSFADRGWVRFGFLFLNKEPIAAQLRICSNNIAYCLDTVHDQKYNQFSPGAILRAEFSKYLIDVDEVSEIDNLRGDETYKKSWTPKRRERIGFLIFNKNFKGTFLSILMTKCLPFIEKNKYMVLIKSYIMKYFAKRN